MRSVGMTQPVKLLKSVFSLMLGALWLVWIVLGVPGLSPSGSLLLDRTALSILDFS